MKLGSLDFYVKATRDNPAERYAVVCNGWGDEVQVRIGPLAPDIYPGFIADARAFYRCFLDWTKQVEPALAKSSDLRTGPPTRISLPSASEKPWLGMMDDRPTTQDIVDKHMPPNAS